MFVPMEASSASLVAPTVATAVGGQITVASSSRSSIHLPISQIQVIATLLSAQQFEPWGIFRIEQGISDECRSVIGRIPACDLRRDRKEQL